MYDSLAEAAEGQGVSLGEAALRAEADEGIRTRAEGEEALARALRVMRGAIASGLAGGLRSFGGLACGNAAKMAGAPGPLSGTLFDRTIASALAVQEVNAAMGVIVAAPTAGGAGVLPAVLLGLAQERGIGNAVLVRGLAAAGLVGAVIAARAPPLAIPTVTTV